MANGIGKWEKVQGLRHKIAHPRMGSHIPYLDYYRFQKLREGCSDLDDYLAKEIGPSPMSKIMFYSLPYDMGNAGDLIKHGALSIAVRWWCKHYGGGEFIRFADPFGGCPWEDVENREIKRRLEKLSSGDIGSFVEKCLWDGSLYYNSGHIVKRAAQGLDVEVWTSDANEIARSDLQASGLLMLDEKYKNKKKEYDNENGYSIFDHAADFDFILIDPFKDFLPNAYNHFDRIRDIINENPNIFIMVFILDMYTELYTEQNRGEVKRVHDDYCEIKDALFKHCAFSLRCPAILEKRGVDGENKYDMEILLISNQLTNPKADELRKELRDYADALTEVLPLGGKKIEFWPK